MQKMQSIGMETSLELGTVTAAVVVAAAALSSITLSSGLRNTQSTAHRTLLSVKNRLRLFIVLPLKMLIKISSESQCHVVPDNKAYTTMNKMPIYFSCKI